MKKEFTIEELIEWFLRYRSWSTGDPIDNIGQVDFEEELFKLILYIKRNNI
jgi:hypothetical protein